MLQLILDVFGYLGSLLLLIAGLKLLLAGFKVSGGLITAGVFISAIFLNIHQFVAISWADGEGMPFWYQASLFTGQLGLATVGLGVLNLARHAISKELQSPSAEEGK